MGRDGAGRRVVCAGVGEPVGVLVRPFSSVVSVGSSEVYTFEPSGRLHAAFAGGHHFRRGLDGRVLKTWRDADRLQQQWISEGESARVIEHVYARVEQAAHHPEWPDAIRAAIDGILSWTPARYQDHSDRFHAVYQPVSILPPDQYLAVVVQATLGCSWNRCAFCDFYRDRPFSIRPRDALDQHIAQVRAFLGPGLAMRRSVFLGDANPLSAPWKPLEAMFAAVRAGFPEGGPGPSWQNTYAFIDAWGGRKRTEREIVALKAMGLRRVYLGLETGHDRLLARVNKRGDGALASEVVNRFKAAGVQVGVIVLLGLGGASYCEAHTADTAVVLNRMQLGQGDVIYFSDLVPSPHLPYAHQMAAEGVRSLSDEEMAEQQRRIEGALTFTAPGRPKLARYEIRRFVY